jgi:hypothetical protein
MICGALRNFAHVVARQRRRVGSVLKRRASCSTRDIAREEHQGVYARLRACEEIGAAPDL